MIVLLEIQLVYLLTYLSDDCLYPIKCRQIKNSYEQHNYQAFAINRIDTPTTNDNGPLILSYDQMIDIADSALVDDPNNPDWLGLKGYALYHLGKYQEAISYYDKVLEINPESVDALTNKLQSIEALNISINA